MFIPLFYNESGLLDTRSIGFGTMKETFALALSVLRLPLTYQQGPKLSHPDDDEHRGVVEKCSPQVVIDPNVLTLPWPLRRGLTTSLVMSTTLVLIKTNSLPWPLRWDRPDVGHTRPPTKRPLWFRAGWKFGFKQRPWAWKKIGISQDQKSIHFDKKKGEGLCPTNISYTKGQFNRHNHQNWQLNQYDHWSLITSISFGPRKYPLFFPTQHQSSMYDIWSRAQTYRSPVS